MAGVCFEWDPEKDRRVIAEDLSYRGSERRYYCFGAVGEGIMTVRFTSRTDAIRIIGAGHSES